jgi:hypothetical protein
MHQDLVIDCPGRALIDGQHLDDLEDQIKKLKVIYAPRFVG